MTTHSKKFTTVLSSSLLLSLLALTGCDKPAVPKADTAAVAPAVQPAPYTPPTADQLSQMVAPIALFPDKLVGQVLAGATYPQQITDANQWLAQNPSLKGDALQSAESNQPWDVSVKSLTTFPSVLGQMASNIQWTTSLGEAYVNDPTDVMNAIQVLRLRAQQAGNLKTSQHLRVSTSARPLSPAPQDYVASSPSETRVYDGPAVIAPPPQTIVIESAQPDVVYVPRYNPAVVYGEPVRVYPGWRDEQPVYQSGYATSTLVETGAISFGLGVLVGAAVSHHDGWGWNSWGVNWGGPGPDRGYDHGWRRPAVVYNNATYVSKSVTVVNRVNNVTNNTVNNNSYNNNVGNRSVSNNIVTNNNVNSNNYRAADNHYQTVNNNTVNRNQPIAMNAAPAAVAPRAMMSMPHFTPHDAVPGARPSAASLSMQAQHAMPPPHINQLPASPRVHLNQFAANPHNGQTGSAPSMPQFQSSLAMQPHSTQRQPELPHVAQQEQHQALHPAREAEHGVDAARMARPEVNVPAREETRLAAMAEHSQPVTEHGREAAMRQPAQPENHFLATGAPVRHVESPMPNNHPAPQHDSNLDRQQAHSVRQDVLAVHPAHPRPTEAAQAKHAENHAEHGHNTEKQEKHAGQEHHA